MINIPPENRAKLKRHYPYFGPYVPDVVREKIKCLWPDPSSYTHGWKWDNGAGFWQYELLLCDIDADTIDPAGYVAIVPLGNGRYLLRFWLDLELSQKHPENLDFGPEDLINPEHPEYLVFDSAAEAKSYLDTLLAVTSPDIPIL